MQREDLRTLVRALRDLDRWDHQQLADLVGREFKMRRRPARRCPRCRGPLDGWIAAYGGQVSYCKLCTSFEQALEFLAAHQPAEAEGQEKA